MSGAGAGAGGGGGGGGGSAAATAVVAVGPVVNAEDNVGDVAVVAIEDVKPGIEGELPSDMGEPNPIVCGRAHSMRLALALALALATSSRNVLSVRSHPLLRRRSSTSWMGSRVVVVVVVLVRTPWPWPCAWASVVGVVEPAPGNVGGGGGSGGKAEDKDEDEVEAERTGSAPCAKNAGMLSPRGVVATETGMAPKLSSAAAASARWSR